MQKWLTELKEIQNNLEISKEGSDRTWLNKD